MKRLLLFIFYILLSINPSVAQSLRMATFNIRYLNGDKGTERCWENRRDSLIHFLQQQRLSIFDLQEVLHPQMQDIIAAFPDYGYVGVGREDGHEKGEYSPIFYDKKVWKAKKEGFFWLSETPDVAGSMGWDAACTRIATWSLLRHRQSGKQVIVFNTHFDHVGHTARIESAKLIMQRAKQIAADTPLILTGDFNVSSDDSVYTTITTNAECPLYDTQLATCEHQGVGYTFHGFGKYPASSCSKIDFIFASPQIHTLSTTIPGEDRNSAHPFYMSDHNPVIIEYSIDHLK